MMQRVECTQCSELVELTGAGSLTLPYVCNECSEAKEFQEKIDPRAGSGVIDPEYIPSTPTIGDFATNPTLKAQLADHGYVLVPVTEAEKESDHEGATVEATTELISDLEEQLDLTKATLENSRAQVDAHRDLNAELTKKVEYLEHRMGDYLNAIEEYRTEKNGLRKKVDAAVVTQKEDDETINALVSANLKLYTDKQFLQELARKEHIKAVKATLDLRQAEGDLAYANTKVRFYRARREELLEKYVFAGFWRRVWHVFVG